MSFGRQYPPYPKLVGWDDQGKCVHIQDTLPEEFDAEVANHIWFLAEEASERVNVAIKRLEGEG